LHAAPEALVEVHRLIQEGGPRDAEWVLAWDDALLTLDTPDGQRVLEAPRASAQRLVALYELYAQGKISFDTPHGSLVFKKQSAAVAAVRWYASWAPDPPPGHWIRWIGWLIHGVLLVLMAVALVGPFVAYFGLRQWLRVRRIERLVAEAQRQTEPGAAELGH
jgi:hypothetical protein